MSFLSVITFGLIKDRPSGLLWTLAGLRYDGVSPEWLGHRYTATFRRGTEDREVYYHFNNFKELPRVKKLVAKEMTKLNEIEVG